MIQYYLVGLSVFLILFAIASVSISFSKLRHAYKLYQAAEYERKDSDALFKRAEAIFIENKEFMLKEEKNVNAQATEALGLLTKRTRIMIGNMIEFKKDVEKMVHYMEEDMDDVQMDAMKVLGDDLEHQINSMESWHFQWYGSHYNIEAQKDDFLGNGGGSKN